MKKKEIITGSAVMLIIFSIFLGVGYMNSIKGSDKNEDIFVENNETKVSKEAEPAKEIRVEIRGEIKNPGVYTLATGSRVEELIIKAGGFTEFADTENLVSQAKKLKDEERIYIKRKTASEVNVLPQSSAIANGPASNSQMDEKININSASKEELMKIPGVGEVTAQKILDYREKNGDFKTIEELKNIDRIGDKTLEKMREKIDIQ